MAVHGASDGEASAGAFAAGEAPLAAGRNACRVTVVCTRFSGAPPWRSGVTVPGCSPMVTVAGAPPVFFTVTVAVACPCQGTVLSMLAGVTLSWPAGSAKLALVAKLTATFTDL